MAFLFSFKKTSFSHPHPHRPAPLKQENKPQRSPLPSFWYLSRKMLLPSSVPWKTGSQESWKMDTYKSVPNSRLSSSFFFWYSPSFLSHLSTAEQNVHFPLFQNLCLIFSAKTILGPCSFSDTHSFKATEPVRGCGFNKLSQCWYLSACQFKNPFMSTIDTAEREVHSQETAGK